MSRGEVKFTPRPAMSMSFFPGNDFQAGQIRDKETVRKEFKHSLAETLR